MKLIKNLTLGTFLFVFASTAFAQDKSGASFGIKGGLNYARILSLQPELLYSRQGFENTVQPFLGNSYKVTYKIDYINVPVLAKLKLGNVFSIEAGPQFGMKVSEKVESDNNVSDENDVNSFDTAIAGGLSLNFNGGAFIFGRFTQSLNEVVKDSGSKNMVIQAGIGFKM